MMGVKQFCLKCFSKIIAFHIFSWVVNDSADVSCFELVSDTKVPYCNVFSFLLLDFCLILSNWIVLVLFCPIVTSNPKGFNGEFTLNFFL